MKKAIIQSERLLQFAKHLKTLEKNYAGGYYDTIELVELESKVRIHYWMTFDMCILIQLVTAFPDDWCFFNGTAIPLLLGKTLNDGPIHCFSIWFGVGPEMICHLLDIEGYQQTEMYGGVNLTLDSGPQDYAKNFEDLALWSQSRTKSEK